MHGVLPVGTMHCLLLSVADRWYGHLMASAHLWVQYSGNVLVYSAVSPCDGDWYGGISALNSESFLDALADADVSASGGVSEAGLRQFWRGRIGLSKEEQLQVLALSATPYQCSHFTSGSLHVMTTPRKT